MSEIIARQPNGLLCRWSTVIDGITHYNMTEEDYVGLCARQAREQARRDLMRENFVRPFDEITTLRDELHKAGEPTEEIDEIIKAAHEPMSSGIREVCIRPGCPLRKPPMQEDRIDAIRNIALATGMPIQNVISLLEDVEKISEATMEKVKLIYKKQK